MANWFNRAKYAIATGGLNLSTDTIKFLLLDEDYAFDPDDNFVSDLVADEVSGTGYTGGYAGSGRKTLANKTVTEDDSGNIAVWDADDPTAYSSITLTEAIKWAVFWKPNTADADSIVICALEFDPVIVTVGYDLQLYWPTTGISTIE